MGQPSHRPRWGVAKLPLVGSARALTAHAPPALRWTSRTARACQSADTVTG